MIPEQYVEKETAQLLRKAGFPQEGGYDCFFDKDNERYSIPTQSQAQRWLRKQGVQVNIGYYINRDNNGKQIKGRWLLDFREIPSANPISKAEWYFVTLDRKWPTSYEAAAESGIQAVCLYLIEKGGSQ